MIADVTYLAARPEEEWFLSEQFRAIHHRREWVEEREAHEVQRKKRGAR